MLKNLLSIYENSILFPVKPVNPSEQFYIFYNEIENEWIAIPKAEITEKELTLLKTIYQLVEYKNPAEQFRCKGMGYLFILDGPLPTSKSETYLRFIQFQFNSDDTNQSEIESALKGFFSEEVISHLGKQQSRYCH